MTLYKNLCKEFRHGIMALNTYQIWPNCLLGTLGAKDFSSAVSGFCQVFIVTRAKSFAAREKNLWYPGYLLGKIFVNWTSFPY